jgi:hypothetical protein
MRNSLLKSLASLAVCCMVMALAAPSFAQVRGSARSRAYSRASVDRLIRQAENRSDQFVAIFDRSLDRSRFEGTLREDRLNDRARELEGQLNIIRQEFNRAGNYYEIRSHVASALTAAQGINTVMRNRRLNAGVERQWILLRSELNRLASVFNLRQLR